MTFSATDLLSVYWEAGERRKVGRLALRQRRILFEYDPGFLASGFEISPFQLPLQAGVFTAPDTIFDGLHGVFNDSLPDGWGRLLLERTVEKHGVRRGQLNALDRLAYVGRSGMGALSYEPDRSLEAGDDAPLALDRLAEESAIVLAGETEDVFEDLLRLNGSSAGARPKIVAQVSANKARIVHGHSDLRPGFEHWMIKFGSSQDPRDIGPIEYAYSLMAREAGVEVPETHLFRTRKRGYFGVKRFDRRGGQRIHMHSLSGLIHADHRVPALDYNLILRVVWVLTKNIAEVEKAYALACFNVLAHNRDDHAKNFSFVLYDAVAWAFAPAYDLTFSDGPGGEQSSMVMGEGRNPGVEQLKALGKEHILKNAPGILAKVQEAVSRWRQHAAAAGVTAKSTKEIAGRIGATGENSRRTGATR
ncbi:MAG: type II toxin-antitoxin system HipA family toxin [Acidobacteria bacterium]|nr:type II toxin-antitoxin system HipA family toxin [Acidobacteriota bacterium]